MIRFAAAAALALATALPAFAQEGKQPPGGRGGGRGMFGQPPIGASFVQDLQMKEVQEDLKLSDDQKAKLGPLKDELTEGDK